MTDDELIGGHVPAPYCPECGQSENLEAYVSLLDAEVVRLTEERDRWKRIVETDAMSRVAAEYRTEIDELETEVARLTEALSWMSGHDRAGLNHLDEMMRASTERDDAEAEVARLRELVAEAAELLDVPENPDGPPIVGPWDDFCFRARLALAPTTEGQP